ncbi:MAG: MotA/TolQ/ExbB proton channel family protein [Verrucomicrobiales bacterium]
MSRLFHGFVFLCLGAATLPAQEPVAEREAAYRDAAASVDEDLRSALDELAEVRERIAEEKPAIAAEANTIAANLREKRRRADLARTSRDAAEDEFEKAENDLKTWRDERNYLEGLLLDFRKTYESEQSLARNESERTLLDDRSTDGRLELVDRALARAENVGSAETVDGEALGEDGVVIEGTFVEAGPVGWFLADDASTSGLVAESPDLRPELVPGTADATAIGRLLRGEIASPALDPTLGTAAALTETETSLLRHIQQGGFWIYPILLLALVALVAAVAKWIQLMKIREVRPGTVQAVLEAVRRGEPQKAREALVTVRHPAGRLLDRGIQLTAPGQVRPRDEIEEALYEKYVEAIPPLQRGLPLIAIASATAPLLGLLGTVTGMIETFRLINIFGTGDAKSLASGISEALVTTEFGLIVAIPALILHALLSRKVQAIRNTMEMTSLAFVNGLPAAGGGPETRAEISSP